MRSIRFFSALVLFISPAAALAGIPPFFVSEQQYRFDSNDLRCRLDKDKRCSLEIHRDENHHDYSLNYIEIKDNGQLFDPTQLASALEQLRAARAEGQQPTVLIYAHGWHNNAGEIDQSGPRDCSDNLFKGDVAKFRNCGLKAFADNTFPTQVGAAPRVVGIYLAWHGTDFGWPPLYYVPSYPFRRHFARKVGESGMADALRAIFDEIEMDRDAYFVVAMGHSFGARVLEAATEIVDPKKQSPNNGIIAKYRTGQKLAPQTLVHRLPVDLVFYVNSASSHSVALKTIANWRETCRAAPTTVGCDKNPLYLAVSSRADVLTSIVLPVANVVFFAPLTDQYHLIAAANTPWLQTHQLPKRMAVRPPSDPADGFWFDVPLSATQTDYYDVVPKPARFGHEKTPAIFWAMNSDRWIASLQGILHGIPVLRELIPRRWVISTHGDVWNVAVVNMLRAVIAREEEKLRDTVNVRRIKASLVAESPIAQ